MEAPLLIYSDRLEFIFRGLVPSFVIGSGHARRLPVKNEKPSRQIYFGGERKLIEAYGSTGTKARRELP